MQDMPTPMTTRQLDDILATLATLPTAQIDRQPSAVTVQATKKATGERVTVLSAITGNGVYWAVKAVPNLITIKFEATEK